MPRRSTRVGAPPPPPQGAEVSTSVEHAAASSRSSAAVWWGGAYTGSPAASSPQAVPTDKQAGQAAAAEFSSPTSDPQHWGEDPHPPGGFLSYFHNPSSLPLPHQVPNQSAMSQNFNFIGGPSHYAPFMATRPSAAKGIPSPSVCKSSTPLAPSGLQSQPPINVDSGDDDGEIRTDKRIAWTKEEDLRLMSSWLNNSNDPINGNNKKNDRYWLQIGESRGFPGMLGSIDCMHWQWEKCPVAWRGQFTRGDHGVPTMILEAVASHDLRIWHAFFGVAGSNNDINMLNQSPLFIEELKGEAPQVQFTVNGTQYDKGYYLADGIYPEWTVFVKTIPLPQTEKNKLFARHQEGVRKDVERAFGVLQSRFNIVRRPARLWRRIAVGKNHGSLHHSS